MDVLCSSPPEDVASISDLPDEVLEYILSLLSPYRDLESCHAVCRRWEACCRRVIAHHHTNFHWHVGRGGLLWQHQPTPETATTITKRYSHCAVYDSASCSMFVFGGCTSTSSTFNDLWQLDLATRIWRRPLAMGTYPRLENSFSKLSCCGVDKSKSDRNQTISLLIQSKQDTHVTSQLTKHTRTWVVTKY